MRNLVTFVALAVLGFCIWKYQSDKKPAITPSSQSPQTATPAPGQRVALSGSLAPWVTQTCGKLDLTKAEDLVPPLTVVRERILKDKSRVEAAKQPIYGLAVSVVDDLVRLADERTKALEALLQASKDGKSSLDSQGTAVGSKEFFAKAANRRWQDATGQAKPKIDQEMASLRDAEQKWNARLPEGSPVDHHDISALDKVLVTVDTKDVSASALERSKFNATRTLYPWRSAYYQKYGISAPR